MKYVLVLAFLLPLVSHSGQDAACIFPFYTPGQLELPAIGTKATLKRQVTIEQIQATSRITGDYNPVHTDVEYARNVRGFRDVVAHGVLVTGLISNVLGNYLPGPGTVFLQQEATLHGPTFPNDTLTAEAEIVELDQRRGHPILRVGVVNQRGEIILQGQVKVAYAPVAGYKSRVFSMRSVEPYRFNPPVLLDSNSSFIPGGRVAPEVGTTLQIQQRITLAQIEATAEVTGDYNPLHMDREFAHASIGSKNVVAHGILIAGLVSNLIGNYLPGPGATLVAQESSMSRPVHPGDVLTATGKVEARDGEYLTVGIQVTNQHQKSVLRGRVKVAYAPFSTNPAIDR